MPFTLAPLCGSHARILIKILIRIQTGKTVREARERAGSHQFKAELVALCFPPGSLVRLLMKILGGAGGEEEKRKKRKKRKKCKKA